ncbi:hypothetical protein ACFY9S_19395 [Streptomyces sp. NPDC012474]|uniref:hypothetical protein n=1 Tax=Streptomyces sp. NPDC012474 TaxID=3364836 RepID=UPI0036E7FBC0
MADEQGLAHSQRRHWQDTYAAHPGMYGEKPSEPVVNAASAFQAAGAKNVLELDTGHGPRRPVLRPRGLHRPGH